MVLLMNTILGGNLMEHHPYMPVGEINHEGQKRNVIKHTIDLLKKYEGDEKIRQVIVNLTVRLEQIVS